jgi:hypothetical protein
MPKVIEMPLIRPKNDLKAHKSIKNGRKEPIITKTSKTLQKLSKGFKNGYYYEYAHTYPNPTYENGLKSIPFESCLIHNKSDRILIETNPKWNTDLLKYEYDNECKDFVVKELYTTNNFKSANHRKIKALNRFCDKYQPLYENKKVTLFFLTFTNAQKCRPFKEMVNIISHYFKRAGYPILDYVWTCEISKNLHFHYHLCVATDRMELKGKTIPKLLKFNKLWGQRTEIDFVKKNVKFYLSKYFAKNNSRAKMINADNGKLTNVRSYGISKIK